MRILKVLVVLAMAISLTGLVYAETQSVKISGDLTVRSFMRGNYDMAHNHQENDTTRTGIEDDWQTYFMSTTEIQVEADLTDNVSGVIRLFNQRDWDVAGKEVNVNTNMMDGYTYNANEFSVGVDLAYIELKEFLYSPLTLKIGRQDLWFGKGFIVGKNQRSPFGSINAIEYTTLESFDAVRATLDYDPWTIDLVAAKIWENAIQSQDDTDLYGANVGYVFDVYNAEAEAYWFLKNDRSKDTWNVKEGNTVNTLGTRGSLDPIENWTVAGEIAVQWGDYVGSRTQLEKRKRTAWAVDASVECRHFEKQYAWKPKMGVEYIYYSGDKNIGEETPQSTGTYTGWDAMYRGKFDSKIREFMGTYYLSAQDVNNGSSNVSPSYPDASTTNQHQIIVMGSLQPTDSLMLNARYINFFQQYETFHKDPARTSEIVKDPRYLGAEVDLELTWDYTEDVSFGLLTAWFFPGSHYYDQSDSIVTDVVGTCKLSF